MLQLVSPAVQYQHGYCVLRQEFVEAQEPFVPFVVAEPVADFPALVSRLQGFAGGVGLGAGFVPHSTYWLVDGDEVLAVLNMRHRLSESLRQHGGHIGYGVKPSARGRGCASAALAQALPIAWERGLDSVLLTCDRSNLASARVIVKHGGLYEGETWFDEDDDFVQRYWIHRA